ncbi:hypothetical protein ScPMuIL_017183 [Solemya velum]
MQENFAVTDSDWEPAILTPRISSVGADNNNDRFSSNHSPEKSQSSVNHRKLEHGKVIKFDGDILSAKFESDLNFGDIDTFSLISSDSNERMDETFHLFEDDADMKCDVRDIDSSDNMPVITGLFSNFSESNSHTNMMDLENSHAIKSCDHEKMTEQKSDFSVNSPEGHSDNVRDGMVYKRVFDVPNRNKRSCEVPGGDLNSQSSLEQNTSHGTDESLGTEESDVVEELKMAGISPNPKNSFSDENVSRIQNDNVRCDTPQVFNGFTSKHHHIRHIMRRVPISSRVDVILNNGLFRKHLKKLNDQACLTHYETSEFGIDNRTPTPECSCDSSGNPNGIVENSFSNLSDTHNFDRDSSEKPLSDTQRDSLTSLGAIDRNHNVCENKQSEVESVSTDRKNVSQTNHQFVSSSQTLPRSNKPKILLRSRNRLHIPTYDEFRRLPKSKTVENLNSIGKTDDFEKSRARLWKHLSSDDMSKCKISEPLNSSVAETRGERSGSLTKSSSGEIFNTSEKSSVSDSAAEVMEVNEYEGRSDIVVKFEGRRDTTKSPPEDKSDKKTEAIFGSNNEISSDQIMENVASSSKLSQSERFLQKEKKELTESAKTKDCDKSEFNQATENISDTARRKSSSIQNERNRNGCTQNAGSFGFPPGGVVPMDSVLEDSLNDSPFGKGNSSLSTVSTCNSSLHLSDVITSPNNFSVESEEDLVFYEQDGTNMTEQTDTAGENTGHEESANQTPITRSTSDVSDLTANSNRRKRGRKTRPYKSDPFTGSRPVSVGEESQDNNTVDCLKEESLSSQQTSLQSLEELSEEELDTDNERKMRNRLSNVSVASTDSGVMGQDCTQEVNSHPGKSLCRSPTTVSLESQASLDFGDKDSGCFMCVENLLEGTDGKSQVCEKCEKKFIQRQETIQEIVDTEISYGRDLNILKQEFYEPMKSNGLMSSEQLETIFSNLDELNHVNKQFVEKIELSIEAASRNKDMGMKTVNLGSLFLESSTMFLTFESYCVNQAQAPILLEQLEKDKELLRIFLLVSQTDNPLLRRMHLKSFLMVPVQRIMKYPLLLERLFKCTPKIPRRSGEHSRSKGQN